MELETKFARFDDALSVTEGHVIEGYASLFGAKDQGGDVVVKGAYEASLKQLKAEKRHVRMLWQHDPTQPIGVWDEVREDGKGLYVKGRILESVEKGREACALLAAGAIDGLSIGYRTRKAVKSGSGKHKGPNGSGRLLQELELWEVSLVTFPMLPSARVAAKGDIPADENLRELAAVFEAARQEIARG